MSRLGRLPIPIPDKVKVTLQGSHVSVEGPLGKLSKDLPAGLTAQIQDKTLVVSRASDSTLHKSLHGTLRKVLLNMVVGTDKGWSKELRIEGVGFRAAIVGTKLNMTLGFSHPVDYEIPAGIKITVDAKQTGLVVHGANKELVGQVAAEIREFKPPEPYKGTGIRYVNEVVRRKAGKAAAGATGAVGGAKK
jgi:large subunit ribosomal protein L6